MIKPSSEVHAPGCSSCTKKVNLQVKISEWTQHTSLFQVC